MARRKQIHTYKERDSEMEGCGRIRVCKMELIDMAFNGKLENWAGPFSFFNNMGLAQKIFIIKWPGPRKYLNQPTGQKKFKTNLE